MEVDHPKVYIHHKDYFLLANVTRANTMLIYSSGCSNITKIQASGYRQLSLGRGGEDSTGWEKLALNRLVLQKLTHAIKKKQTPPSRRNYKHKWGSKSYKGKK